MGLTTAVALRWHRWPSAVSCQGFESERRKRLHLERLHDVTWCDVTSRHVKWCDSQTRWNGFSWKRREIRWRKKIKKNIVLVSGSREQRHHHHRQRRQFDDFNDTDNVDTDTATFNVLFTKKRKSRARTEPGFKRKNQNFNRLRFQLRKK